MLSFEDFAGQSAHVAQLQSDFAQQTYVHAYLFCGPRGTGKKSVARLCAMAAVCRAEGKRPCGACGPCRRVMSDTHPDLHTIVPEKGKQTIGVGVLREVLETVAVKSFEDAAKAIVFPEAHKMTPAAQNCLLKTLEEPPQDTVFFLITDQPGALLATIVSRCRVLRFHPLDDEACAKRLMALGLSEQDARRRARMAEGCVGQALEIGEERLKLLEQLTKDVFSVHRPGDVLSVVNLYKDDKERQKMIMDLLEAAVRTGADIAVCGKWLEYARRSKQVCWETEQLLTREEAMGQLLDDRQMQNSLWDKLVRRELFAGIRFPVGKRYEDLAVMYRVIEQASRVCCLPRPMYHYLQRQGSIMADASLDNRIEYHAAAYDRWVDMMPRWPQYRQQLLLSVARCSIGMWCSWLSASSEQRGQYRNRMGQLSEVARELDPDVLSASCVGRLGKIRKTGRLRKK